MSLITLQSTICIVFFAVCITGQDPLELKGAWNLQGADTARKMRGRLVIKEQKKYTYRIFPSTMESGTYTIEDNNITFKTDNNKIRKGLIEIDNGAIKKLCVGKLGGPRPERNESNFESGIVLWDVTRLTSE